MEHQIKIICDHREQRSGIIKRLFEMGTVIDTKSLAVGDFILSDRVCVERKTTEDFLQSIIDNRLFEQIENMSSSFEKPLIIVEGAGNIYEKRMIHPNAIRGAIAALAIDFRVPILITENEEETALYLYSIASREQIDKKVSISIRGEKKPVEKSFMQEFIVSGLPGIGRGTAQNLLRHFKTVKAIVNAEEKEMTAVEKIGKKKAKQMREILDWEYE